VPRIAPFTGARITEWFVLQAFDGQAGRAPIGDQLFAIRRDEVRHGVAAVQMAMQPESAIHCVDHPVATACEFAVR
jgi:hypothetical protein